MGELINYPLIYLQWVNTIYSYPRSYISYSYKWSSTFVETLKICWLFSVENATSGDFSLLYTGLLSNVCYVNQIISARNEFLLAYLFMYYGKFIHSLQKWQPRISVNEF